MEIDQFMWDHKDFLILFAAGNDGHILGYSSLGSQAEAKNSISVGASMNDILAFRYMAENIIDYNARAKSAADTMLDAFGCLDSNCIERTPQATQLCSFFSNFTEAECCSSTYICGIGSGCGCKFQGLGIYCCKQCYTQFMNSPSSEETYNKENLAYFSSRGPTIDGRIKPDVVG